MVELSQFVAALKEERDAMLASYANPEPTTYVGKRLEQAALSEKQKREVIAALDAALTDAFYTILLGLDGSAALGPLMQQAFTIIDEQGHVVSSGKGDLEAEAYEAFCGGQ